jgi:hypothetical protein
MSSHKFILALALSVVIVGQLTDGVGAGRYKNQLTPILVGSRPALLDASTVPSQGTSSLRSKKTCYSLLWFSKIVGLLLIHIFV